MSLTHVCIWDEKAGYRSISVEEACSMFPDTVSAHRGIFVCALCAQNVGLTAPGIYTRYFYHSSDDQEKECEDRARLYRQAIISYNNHPMPLRIKQESSDNYSLELGFFHVPSSIISEPLCQKITIIDSHRKRYIYLFERISSEGITYLNVGNFPSSEYQLFYENPSPNLSHYWPSKTIGINSAGSFFDYVSGKILFPGGKAYSQHDYYLLQKESLTDAPNGVYYERLATVRIDSSTVWRLYKICVLDFSSEVASFFLKRSIFLTQKPVVFYPVWPPYVEDPYFLYHQDPKMYFYMQGEDAELNIFPKTECIQHECLEEGKLYRIEATCKEQLLALGQSGAIGFSYLTTKNLDMEAELPQVQIKDIDGQEITEECCGQLPKRKLLMLETAFDGKVVVLKQGRVIEIRHLVAEKIVTIGELAFGYTLQIFQGCDVVRTVSFEKQRQDVDLSVQDQKILWKLNHCHGPMVAVPHSLGAIAQKFSNLPKVKAWLYRVIRRGEMHADVLTLLMSYQISKRK